MLGMRNPTVGTQYILSPGVVFKRLPQGSLVFVSDSGWPSYKRYRYQIEGLSLEAANNFIETYFKNQAGVPISITDYLNVTYTGIITSQSIQKQRKRDACSYMLSFEVEEV
jgi:hypothetical protein